MRPSLTATGVTGDDKGLNFVAYAMDAVTLDPLDLGERYRHPVVRALRT